MRDFQTGRTVLVEIGKFLVMGPDSRTHTVRLVRGDQGSYMIPCCESAVWGAAGDGSCGDWWPREAGLEPEPGNDRGM